MGAAANADVAKALTVLLPASTHGWPTAAEAPRLARVCARADHESLADGDEAQLARAFDLLPRGLPVAALTRDFDRGDAALRCWLRADPGHVRADLGAGRLLACGELGLDADEVASLLQALRPMFGDDGAPISDGAPSRWYLSLPHEARLPVLPPPSRVLGDDIFAHLPQGDAGRRWRRLISESQVILHNHPVNAARVAAGKLPVNTLWFWGGGVLPDHVRSAHRLVLSDDVLVAALARAARVPHRSGERDVAAMPTPGGALLDLRRVRDPREIEREAIEPALARLARREIDALILDAADGQRWCYRHAHRWRWWRRARRRSA